MKSVTHRKQGSARSRLEFIPSTTGIATNPEYQPMLARLCSAVGDINAAGISRIEYVLQVAAVIVKARARK